MKTIFLIDDEQNQLTLLSGAIEQRGYKVITFSSPKEALQSIDKYLPFLVITDMKMSSMSGKEVLREIKKKYFDVEVIVITGYGDVPEAVECMKEGAYYYMLKPVDLYELYEIIERISNNVRIQNQANILREEIEGLYGSVIFADPIMKDIIKTARKVAKTDTPVLITGETGTGKEVLARFIHKESNKNGAFVAVNMGAMPANLIESELFGYRKGAFTGADKSKKGKFELADGGTLFLDEIGDMPVEMQVKLLRAIEYKQIDPLGSTESVIVDVRIIAATSKNMDELVKEGKFREDLYYRISTIRLQLPPLRERTGDIIPLVKHFINEISLKMHRKPPIIDKKAEEMLLNYNWRGNIRELKNVIERSLILQDEEIFNPLIQEINEKESGGGLIRTLKEIEKEHIRKVLAYTKGNRKKAAEILGIHRNTLLLKLKEYGLEK